MKMQVINPGPCTTVQDLGRFGYQTSGFTPSGAVDRVAAMQANFLVGNEPGEAILEFCMMAPVLVFECSVLLAVTGGDFTVSVSGRDIPAYTAFRADAGEQVTISFGANGLYGCIAVAGGFDIPPVMGSRSTDMKCGFGGWNGRKLMKDDALPLRMPGAFQKWRIGSTLSAPVYSGNVIRVVPGPQDNMFTEAGKRTFYGSEYLITSQRDRMGMRLDGAVVETVAGSDIISDGIALGSVQIPGNGTPIVMLAEHQTTGGYAKIATVCTADLSKLVQMRPGSRIRFEAITVGEAQQLLREQTQWLDQQKMRLSGNGSIWVRLKNLFTRK